jgi:3-deoxy-D-manno-octulosonate 8-phosphate phosphatase (KDO 8-P phosphatase)
MKKNRPLIFLLDVDGVMTNGQFIYSSKGKIQKIFGPDDHDGLSLLSQFIEIRFVTGDRKGFDISKKRIVDDMNFKLDLVSTVKRLDWIKKKYSFK